MDELNTFLAELKCAVIDKEKTLIAGGKYSTFTKIRLKNCNAAVKEFETNCQVYDENKIQGPDVVAKMGTSYLKILANIESIV